MTLVDVVKYINKQEVEIIIVKKQFERRSKRGKDMNGLQLWGKFQSSSMR